VKPDGRGQNGLPPAGTGSGSALKKRLLTAGEAAEYLGLSEQTVRQWAHMRRIPCVKLGRALRFDIEDLDLWLEEHRRPAREETARARSP